MSENMQVELLFSEGGALAYYAPVMKIVRVVFVASDATGDPIMKWYPPMEATSKYQALQIAMEQTKSGPPLE